MARQSDTVSMNCMDMTWLALDSINERIVFHAILVIEGEVDASRLNDALLTTVRRHPALRTVLRRKLLRHYREYRDDIDPQILEVHDIVRWRPGAQALSHGVGQSPAGSQEGVAVQSPLAEEGAGPILAGVHLPSLRY